MAWVLLTPRSPPATFAPSLLSSGVQSALKTASLLCPFSVGGGCEILNLSGAGIELDMVPLHFSVGREGSFLCWSWVLCSEPAPRASGPAQSGIFFSGVRGSGRPTRMLALGSEPWVGVPASPRLRPLSERGAASCRGRVSWCAFLRCSGSCDEMGRGALSEPRLPKCHLAVPTPVLLMTFDDSISKMPRVRPEGRGQPC